MPLSDVVFRLQREPKEQQGEQQNQQKVAWSTACPPHPQCQTRQKQYQQDRRPFKHDSCGIVELDAALWIDVAQEPRGASTSIGKCDLAQPLEKLSRRDQRVHVYCRLGCPSLQIAIGIGRRNPPLSDLQVRRMEEVSC